MLSFQWLFRPEKELSATRKNTKIYIIIDDIVKWWYLNCISCRSRFSCDVIAAMSADENKRSLISFFCSFTRSSTFLYCYWCL